jgi:predicted  nucleic acid-binding Zn-ribbon protein
MSGQTDARGVAPDLGLSQEDRKQADRIISSICEIDTLSKQDLEDEYYRRNPQAAQWSDERTHAYRNIQSEYEPKRTKLPGFGEKYDDCGAKIPHACDHCGHVVEIGRTCARSECPRCGSRWVTKRAPRLVARMHEAAKMKEGAQYQHHGVISPPEDLFIEADDPLEELYELGHDVMDACDMDGIMVYHPFRGKSDADHPADQHEDDRGEWQNWIFEGLSFDDVRDELEFSPHLHVIGCTSWFPGGDVTAEIYNKTGWVIHRITERNGSAVSLGDLHSLARATTYALSHVGIDMTGEQNKSEYRKHGSAFHAADCRTLADAKDAVHLVAPDTLGIPSQHVECRNQVLEDEADHDDHDHTTSEDGEAADSDRDSEDDGTVSCRGDLRDFEDVTELLEDPDWRAPIHEDNLEQLERINEVWQQVGGWRGWVEREQTRFRPPPD